MPNAKHIIEGEIDIGPLLTAFDQFHKALQVAKSDLSMTLRRGSVFWNKEMKRFIPIIKILRKGFLVTLSFLMNP